jgi:tRNA pseudouridine38-40 synthase
MTTGAPAARGQAVLRTFGLIVEYDGTAFRGSQLQADARTVQGELERAVERVTGGSARIRLASRTDTGVHATGQVATFAAATRLGAETIRRALNHHLPADIKVRCAQLVPDRFDPRRAALAREYVYTINDGPTPPAIRRHLETHVTATLDAVAMDTAAQSLIGAHDFAAFAGAAAPKLAPTIRRVDAASVTREGALVRFTVRGNAFLHQQVRRIAAALVEVGRGNLGPDRFAQLVNGGRKGDATWLIGPQGLCLTRVIYDAGGSCGLPGPE